MELEVTETLAQAHSLKRIAVSLTSYCGCSQFFAEHD